MADKLKDIAISLGIIAIVLFFFVPFVSYIVAQFAPSMAPILAGPIWRLLLIGVGAIMLLYITVGWGLISNKFIVLYVLILLAADGYLIVKLPELVPQFFSLASTSGTAVPFSLSPIWQAVVVGAGVLGLYWYSKKH